MLNLDSGIDMKTVSETSNRSLPASDRVWKIEADSLFVSSTWVSTRVFKIRPYLFSDENRTHISILGLSTIFAHPKKPSLAVKAYKDNVGVGFLPFMPHPRLLDSS